MFRGVSRPLGLVLLAVLAVAPVVRTLCAWDCGASPVASEAAAVAEHGPHCAQPAGSAEAESPGLMSGGDCDRCDVLGATLRATVRTEIASLATPLPAAPWSGSRHDLKSSDLALASTRAASPPLQAPYPLRI